MELILLERIERLGQMGDVVVVKDGFARNFLLPKNKALRANKKNLEFFEKEKINLEAKNLKLKNEAEAVSEKIVVNNYIIIRQASDTGQLYGSVNSGDVKEKLQEEGFSIEKKKFPQSKILVDRDGYGGLNFAIEIARSILEIDKGYKGEILNHPDLYFSYPTFGG